MLLDWVSDPRSEAGIHEYEDPFWEFRSYAWLADRVRGVSAQLRELGIDRGDIVAIAAADCMDFAPALFGVLHAGATPLPIAPAPASARAEANRTATAILAAVSPTLVLASADEIERARALKADAAIGSEVVQLSPQLIGEFSPAPAPELALLQFTSGSTGRPRGVRVSVDNLESNLAAVRRWADWDTQAGGVSWLPLQHDMGLIGMLVVAVCAQRDLWQMKPTEFLAQPLRWLECFGSGGASITAAPTFGYSYVARRVKRSDLEGLDFSGWRTAVVGAERVLPEALFSFAALLEEFGFRPEALCPAYGMAEATLAITGHPVGTVPRMRRVSSEGAPIGGDMSVGQSLPATAPAAVLPNEGLVVSCGRPLSGLTVEVVGEDGSRLPDGTLGEISVRGASVAEGYYGNQAGVSTRFLADRLLTGDAGFLLDGELFVLGRIADSLKVRGTYIYVEDLEISLASALDLPLSRCVVVGTAGVDSNVAAVLIEAEELDASPEEIRSALRPALGTDVEVRVYLVDRHALIRTTSGKPRRRRISQMLASGELNAELAFTFAAEDQAAAEKTTTPAVTQIAAS